MKEYGTLLHGDVKGANIVFSARNKSTDPSPTLRCALYDFQYIGLGLVSRDLVYFLATTVQSGLLRRSEQERRLLEFYHGELLKTIKSAVPYPFEKFWRHWELAIVDWYRFMAGWGFWGNDSWVEKRAKEIVHAWETSGFVL